MRTTKEVSAKQDPVAICRAVVTRANGEVETYYSYKRPRSLKQAIKLYKHLWYMKQEDDKNA